MGQGSEGSQRGSLEIISEGVFKVCKINQNTDFKGFDNKHSIKYIFREVAWLSW
jgi:hypothetical protein